MVQTKLSIDSARCISDFREAVAHFEIRTKLYHIIFRGKGLEFEGYRTYAPDDDANDIDWKASSRANKYLVKQYKEERKLKFVFVVDVADNMVFGSQQKLKCEYAAEAVIAFMDLISSLGDQAGLILYSSHTKHYYPPSSARNYNDLLMDTISDASHYRGTFSLLSCLEYVLSILDGSVNAVILVSDFLHVSPKVERLLNLLTSRHETMALMVKDPLDITLPDINKEVVIEDGRSGERLLINPRLARRTYEHYAREQEQTVRGLLARNGVDFLSLRTDKGFAFPLAQFLSERIHKEMFL